MSHPVRPSAISDELVALLPRLRRFAVGLTASAPDGDDLLQAACERALERSDQWRPGTRLDSWMYRIMQTIWLDGRRAQAVRTGFVRAQLEPDREDGVARADARLTLATVNEIVAAMPDQYRAVVMLIGVNGMTYQEAASALGVPVGTVMSRLARARQTLFDRLDLAPEDEAAPEAARA